MRWLSLVVGGAVLLAVTSACVSQTPGTPSAGDRPPVPTPSTTAPVPSTGPPTTGQAAVTVCSVRDLALSLGAEEGTAGTVYRALVFTNSGTRTCVIRGFPGVSFVTGDDGHQVGEAARRVGDKGPAITLRAGMTAAAPVGFVAIGNFDPAACQPTPVRGLRVYPPQERRSVFVPFATTGCAGAVPGGQLTVRTVHEGAGLT